MSTILFDIGGTNIRVGLTTDGRRIGKTAIFPTPRRFSDGVKAIADTANRLLEKKRASAVVGGIAGPLDRTRSRLVNSPNVRGWVGKPLKQELARALRAPVVLRNDSELVALGEATRGAGRGYPIVAYLGVGTGLGGARIVDGSIDRNALGSFEPGHQIIEHHGLICPKCGGRGHLEAYVSGAGLIRQYRREPKAIHGKAVWEELARTLAVGVVNAIVFWSPDIVILGGSMMKSHGIPIDIVRREVRKRLTIFPKSPPIVRGTLGDLGGLWGALALLRKK